MAVPVADNSLGVSHIIGLDQSSAALDAGAPTGMTYHGFALTIDDVVIGRITSFTPPSLERSVQWTRELNPATAGQPVDIVPGGESGAFTMTGARAELWNQETEVAFGLGNNAFSLLIQQRKPFVIMEVYKKDQTTVRKYEYRGCWITGKTTTAFDASLDDPRVMVDFTISYGNRVRVK